MTGPVCYNVFKELEPTPPPNIRLCLVDQCLHSNPSGDHPHWKALPPFDSAELALRLSESKCELIKLTVMVSHCWDLTQDGMAQGLLLCREWVNR